MPKMPKPRSTLPDALRRLPIKVDDSVTEGAVLVCADQGFFADDVAAVCAECGAAIVHRPHAPAETRKICLACAPDILARDGGPQDFQVTSKSLQEVAVLLAKPKGRA